MTEIETIDSMHNLARKLNGIVESFRQNNRLSPYFPSMYLPDNVSFKEVDHVDLSLLPLGSQIYVHGQHVHASYWLLELSEKNGQRAVDIWRNLDSTGLTGPIDQIISVQIKGESNSPNWVIENGVIRKGSNFAFPYFDYEPNLQKEAPNSIIASNPDTYWMDNYKSIKLILTPNKNKISTEKI